MNKQKMIVGVVVAVLLFGLGFWTGHHNQPSKVTQITQQTSQKQTDTNTKTDEQKKLDGQVKVSDDQSSIKSTHKTKVTLKMKDGTVIVKETEDTHVDTDRKKNTDVKVAENDTKKADRAVHETEKSSTTTKTVTEYGHAPSWSLSVSGYSTLSDPLRLHTNFVVQRQFQLFGPFSGSVFTSLTDPQNDVVQSLKHASVGLSISVNF